MKKRVCLLVALLAIVIIGFTMNVEAAEIIDRGYCGGEGDGKNLTWTLDSDGVLVIEGQGKMEDLTSMDFMEDYPPIIPLWHEYFDDIDSVIVKYGVTSVGSWAFYYTSLKSIVLPESLVSIGGKAFLDCANLSSIDLPESLMSIGDSAFRNCTSLSSIDLPESLTSIEDNAFEDCISLNSIDLPGSLTSIGDRAFEDCVSLSSIDLSESLVSIGDWAFEGCTSLTSISLPQSLTDIGGWAFCGCTSLTSIDLPQSLTSVEMCTFRRCSSLSSIVIPDSVTIIWGNAFGECESLRSIYIPSSVVIIDYNPFWGTDLKDIYYGGTQAQWNAIKGMEDLNNSGNLNATIHYVDYDYEKLNEFVSRLYRNFLNREPDERGLADWVDALVSGRGTGAKVVAGFVLSPEYKANSLSNKDYVTALYRIIFNREPDAAGLNSWISVIENGCTIKKVLAGFVNSEEFKNLCRDLGIARGIYNSDEIADQNVKIAAFVARLYNICLERTYEQEGLNYWVNALVERTMTGSSVVLGFFGSQEFKNRNLDNTEFVKTAYRAILNREPDPTGLKSWIDALERGKTRDYVLSGFLKSTEFDNLCKEYRIASGNPRKTRDYEYIPDDMEGWTDRELKLARNEIYARKGYIFIDPEMAEYFGKKEWYRPSIPAKDFDEGIFDENEWDYLQVILSEEEKRANEKATMSEKEWLMAEIERFLNTSPANGFLRSTFSEPGYEVNLWGIIDLVGDGVDEDTVLKELKKEGYIPSTDICYINSDYLDKLLYRYTGYGLYDKKWNLSDLSYLKSIDTYYSEHGDVTKIWVRVKEIKNLGNNIYEVKTGPYDDEYWYGNRHFKTIRLRRIEAGDYQFISVQ